ncbi:MAG: ClpX C4-type zinc finger protein [Phycisphaerales bacterium]
MHDPSAQGNDFFKCDFCRRAWAEDRPMVEGHHGSLICASCLTVAYSAVVHQSSGADLAGGTCTMCLEPRDEPQWQSPLHPEARVCRRCIKQSAGVLEHDEEFAWKRP